MKMKLSELKIVESPEGIVSGHLYLRVDDIDAALSIAAGNDLFDISENYHTKGERYNATELRSSTASIGTYIHTGSRYTVYDLGPAYFLFDVEANIMSSIEDLNITK
jgi:hypothetical protein